MGENKKLYKTFNRNDNYDHVIIGSGIRGLTAATWLAKQVKRYYFFLQ